MDKNFNTLCHACRTGDLESADRMISTGVDLNQVDKFDNSPLFLASLCGHEKVVKLLLRSGALCDRDRQEGARCIYGALTDSIRDILLSYDISKATDMNQPFAMHLSSLLVAPAIVTYDMELNVAQGHLPAHKFMLQARCPILNDNRGYDVQEMFGNWFDLDVDVRASHVLELFLKFIYLVPILHTITAEDYDYLIKIAQKLEMNMFAEFMNKVRHVADPSEKSSMMISYQHKFTNLAKEQLKHFVDKYIIDSAVLLTGEEKSIKEISSCSFSQHTYPDVLLSVKNHENELKIYPCHLAVLMRADYFKVIFTDKFSETVAYQESKENRGDGCPYPILELPTFDLFVVEIMLRYLYFDEANIPWQYAMEVIKLGDFILADRLKSMAATVVTQSPKVLERYTIFQILYFAWETRLERLEHFAAKQVAGEIRALKRSKSFREAIVKSAQRISSREETDTIEFVDDIRFYLLEKYRLESDDIWFLEEETDQQFLKESGLLDYQYDVSLLNDILQELGLEA
ncbi:uncharacterized protein KNAG_0G01010 [Huiozyma naganishii CBS 8797]|uniref:BTB domain-containing protein n=1 Tax=Huiozyma naganishii (strain ATCC MYA-139 / BCRC 22969 / CBS 8797 / KCTC 17520 / NBRC 10181 / NCYC 3082 / Yp74L-3) TaxID=1071383 RepID=J7S7T0_HUIN7|nr:hypothetical protein KNAG_0G01010 [Kazachstania naganishii CBS 8797]CCK71159.1 hypothetical protein KNAG_0G01010 [Kazachstania naganishii CBS 8797]